MKIIRCATIGLSLNIFCKGVLQDLKQQGYEVVAISSPDDDLRELAEREQVKTIGVEMDRHINPIKDLKSLWQLYRVFRKEKPDMVHSMTPKAGLLCMMAAWMARVPKRIHTFTGLIWPTSTGLKRKILMMTDKITCACATHVVPESLGVLDDLSAHITTKPLKVLGYGNVMGVDLSYWRNTKELKVKSEKLKVSTLEGERFFVFLFVGRIVGDKGINELVTAFKKLIEMVKLKNDKVIECRLALVGWIEDHLDPVKPETRSLIDSTPEILAVGPQHGDDLQAWYKAADCFVFPSYREGFPNTVLEAGAMELASIVTDINGSREIIFAVNDDKDQEIQDNKPQRKSIHLAEGEMMSIRQNGVVIPSKNADALYDAMLWMIEHDDERLQMGKRARQIVEERWDQGFVREKLYEFYQDVMKN